MSIPGSTNKCWVPIQQVCPIRLDGQCVYYSGSTLPGSNVFTGDSLNTVAFKLNNYISSVATVTSANNGLSSTGTNAVLGQDIGQAGNPAALLSNREIPLSGKAINLLGNTGGLTAGYTTSTTPFTTIDINGTFGVTQGVGYPTQGFLNNQPARMYFVHDSGNHGLSITRVGNNINAANLTFYRTSNANAAIRTAVFTNQQIGRVSYQGVCSDNSTVGLSGSILHRADTIFTNYIAGRFEFETTNLAGSNGIRMMIGTEGQLRCNSYGIGTFAATPVYYLGVDASGNVKEQLASAVPLISTGTAAPATTPAKVGNIYVDTTNKKLYFAAGTTSSADWIIAN